MLCQRVKSVHIRVSLTCQAPSEINICFLVVCAALKKKMDSGLWQEREDSITRETEERETDQSEASIPVTWSVLTNQWETGVTRSVRAADRSRGTERRLVTPPTQVWTKARRSISGSNVCAWERAKKVLTLDSQSIIIHLDFPLISSSISHIMKGAGCDLDFLEITRTSSNS